MLPDLSRYVPYCTPPVRTRLLLRSQRYGLIQPEFEDGFSRNSHVLAPCEHLDSRSTCRAGQDADHGAFPAPRNRPQDGAPGGSPADCPSRPLVLADAGGASSFQVCGAAEVAPASLRERLDADPHLGLTRGV